MKQTSSWNRPAVSRIAVPGWTKLYFFELVFSSPADWTGPVIRYVFKSCSGCNAICRISNFRVILISANETLVFFHDWSLVK